jgi:hypothetical protein
MAFIYDFTDTWTSAGTTYNGIKLNVTNTASSASSLLMDLQIDAVSKFKVDKLGAIKVVGGNGGLFHPVPGQEPLYPSHVAFGVLNEHYHVTANGRHYFYCGTTGIAEIRINGFQVESSSEIGFTPSNFDETPDASFRRDAADTIVMRRGTNAQKFKTYNTFTDVSNYERAVFGWDTNVLTIGTEAAGTGTKRALKMDSSNRAAYDAAPSTTVIRDILISFGLMAAS